MNCVNWMMDYIPECQFVAVREGDKLTKWPVLDKLCWLVNSSVAAGAIAAGAERDIFNNINTIAGEVSRSVELPQRNCQLAVVTAIWWWLWRPFELPLEEPLLNGRIQADINDSETPLLEHAAFCNVACPVCDFEVNSSNQTITNANVQAYVGGTPCKPNLRRNLVFGVEDELTVRLTTASAVTPRQNVVTSALVTGYLIGIDDPNGCLPEAFMAPGVQVTCDEVTNLPDADMSLARQ